MTFYISYSALVFGVSALGVSTFNSLYYFKKRNEYSRYNTILEQKLDSMQRDINVLKSEVDYLSFITR